MTCDHVAFFIAGIHADAGTFGPAHVNEPAGGGKKTGRGILRVDPGFDSMLPAVPLGIEVEALARGDAELLLDEVNAVDHLGHGVLDLQASVHFEEIELAAIVHDELHRAGVPIADLARDRDRGGSHAFTTFFVGSPSRSLFHDFLVTPLRRTVAIADGHDGAVLVGQHLHLDVTRPLDEPL